MSIAVHEEILRFLMEETDDPEMRANQKRMATSWVRVTPGLYDEIIEKGLAPLAHLFERRLGRRLGEDERGALAARLDRLGPDRLGDVVLDLDPPALAAWLADPDAK